MVDITAQSVPDLKNVSVSLNWGGKHFWLKNFTLKLMVNVLSFKIVKFTLSTMLTHLVYGVTVLHPAHRNCWQVYRLSWKHAWVVKQGPTNFRRFRKFSYTDLIFNKLNLIYLLKARMTHINLSLSFNQKYAMALINTTMMIYIINVMVGSVEGRGEMKENKIKINFKSSEQKKILF